MELYEDKKFFRRLPSESLEETILSIRSIEFQFYPVANIYSLIGTFCKLKGVDLNFGFHNRKLKNKEDLFESLTSSITNLSLTFKLLILFKRVQTLNFKGKFVQESLVKKHLPFQPP